MRLRSNFITGTLDSSLGSSAVTLTQDEFLDLPDVDLGSDDYVVLSLDPNGDNGDPEIAYIVDHQVPGTPTNVVTLARGKEGTSAREHASGTRFVVAATNRDFPTKWLVDEPPENPSQWDDEFDQGAGNLDAAWSTWDFETGNTVELRDWGLHLFQGTTNSENFGVYRTLPNPGGGSDDIIIDTKVSIAWDNESTGSIAATAGICFFQDPTSSTGDIVTVVAGRRPPPDEGCSRQYWTAYNTFSSETLHAWEGKAIGSKYLRAYYDPGGPTLSCYLSNDGRSWFAIDAGYSMPFTPTHVGLIANDANTTFSGVHIFDFFRVRSVTVSDQDDLLGPVYGRRGGYRD